MAISPLESSAFTEFTTRGWTIIHKTEPSSGAKPTTTRIAIEKTFTFKTFKSIDRFLKHLMQTILTLNHHPDIIFKPAQKTCFLCLTTHVAGHTLSPQDLAFVIALEKLEQAV